MFPPMYDSEILAELTSQNEGTGPLNKHRPTAIAESLEVCKKIFSWFSIYLNNSLYLPEWQKGTIIFLNWTVEDEKRGGLYVVVKVLIGQFETTFL